MPKPPHLDQRQERVLELALCYKNCNVERSPHYGLTLRVAMLEICKSVWLLIEAGTIETWPSLVLMRCIMSASIRQEQ